MSLKLTSLLGYPLSKAVEQLKCNGIEDYCFIETSASSCFQRKDRADTDVRSANGEMLGKCESRVVRVNENTRTITFSRFLTGMPNSEKEENDG